MTSSKLPLPPGVHVILGGSAGGIFNRNYGSKQRLIDYDVLSCGPTPKCESIAAWEAMRLEYWESLVPGKASRPVVSKEADCRFTSSSRLVR